MPNFVQIFKERGNISFVGMRDTAISLLPIDRTRRNKLYDDLERGKGILDDEEIPADFREDPNLVNKLEIILDEVVSVLLSLAPRGHIRPVFSC